MQQMIDEDGNLWTIGADGAPVFAGRAPSQAPAQPQQGGPAPFTVGRPRAPEPKTPYRFKSNDGSVWEIGPDGQARQVFQDQPAPKSGPSGDPKGAARMANLRALQQNIARVRELYNQNLKGGWPNAISGNIPFRPANEQFNSAGAGLSETGLAAFRVPGVGSQSDAELRAFVDANRPSSSDGDLAIEEKLRNLETRLNATLAEMGQSPEQQGQRDPAALMGAAPGGGGGPVDPFGQGGPTVLPNAAGAQGDAGMGADGATAEGGSRFEQGLAGLPDAVAQMIGQGASSSEITAFLNEQYSPFGASVGPDLAATIGGIIQKHRANPRAPIKSLGSGWDNFSMLPANQETSVLGRMADNPVGNAMMHGTNAATFGIPAYMAGDQGAAVMDATSQSRPGSSMTGEIVGGTAGMLATSGLGGVAARSGNGALRLAGRTLTRNGALGSDMLYGATRGGFENGPEGAALGALGAGAGNRVGAGLIGGAGAALRGVKNKAVNRLSAAGVPLTMSAMSGNKGVLGRFLTGLDSLPVVGANNTARMTDAFETVNRIIAKDAGAPIGHTPSRLGYGGAEDGLAAAGNAIDNSVAGVNAPLDAQFAAEMRAAMALGQQLPDDLAANFRKAMNNRVKPAVDGGSLSGPDFVQALRGLKSYKAEKPKSGFEGDYREALSSVQNALTGNVTRHAGPDVAANLNTANTAYRNFKLIEDSVKRARNGSRSGTQEVYTPSQMNDAIAASKYAKAGTRAPFRQVVDDAQNVLPQSVPNSGTADRLAAIQALALPGALLAGGGGYSTTEGPGAGTIGPLAILAAALTSKTGAKLAQKALTVRSPAVRAAGLKLLKQKRKAGLFGAASGMAVLPSTSQ